jgi:hypothetical protein
MYCVLYGVWCMMYCVLYGVWCMMYDVLYGVWCMMYCVLYDVLYDVINFKYKKLKGVSFFYSTTSTCISAAPN